MNIFEQFYIDTNKPVYHHENKKYYDVNNTLYEFDDIECTLTEILMVQQIHNIDVLEFIIENEYIISGIYYGEYGVLIHNPDAHEILLYIRNYRNKVEATVKSYKELNYEINPLKKYQNFWNLRRIT